MKLIFAFCISTALSTRELKSQPLSWVDQLDKPDAQGVETFVEFMQLKTEIELLKKTMQKDKAAHEVHGPVEDHDCGEIDCDLEAGRVARPKSALVESEDVHYDTTACGDSDCEIKSRVRVKRD